MSSVVIYWDYQNVPSKELAYPSLKLAKTKGKLIKAVVVDNWDKKPSIKEYLTSIGFECINLSQSIENAADFKLVGSLYYELGKNYPKEIILITGDSFALIVIEDAHDLDIKVTVISRQGSYATDIKNKADKFYTPEQIIKTYSAKTYDEQLSLDYYEASYYLIKYVKFCLNQEKPATKDRIINFMANYFHNNGFSKNFPIVKRDGTQFNKLSKFIDAASQDGIITLRDGQIFLV